MVFFFTKAGFFYIHVHMIRAKGNWEKHRQLKKLIGVNQLNIETRASLGRMLLSYINGSCFFKFFHKAISLEVFMVVNTGWCWERGNSLHLHYNAPPHTGPCPLIWAAVFQCPQIYLHQCLESHCTGCFQ